MKKLFNSPNMRRVLCAFLAALMTFETVGSNLAYAVRQEAEPTSPAEVVITDAEGEVIESDTTWEEEYPYGVFAFEDSNLLLSEGGDDGVIKVYRLGGSKGKATACITYVPALTENEEGERIYDYALSARDLTIAYEEAQPITQYQAVGQAPVPYETRAAVVLGENSEGTLLEVNAEAVSYQWEILYGDMWEDIQDATEKTLPLDEEFLSGDYDFRCVYTDENGVRYCTDSYYGEEYVRPEAEEVPEMPDDIELNPEPTYVELGLTDEGEDPYAGWMFELVFAEGEWCKEIHISSLEDELPEGVESALITIDTCVGGEVLTAASQVVLSIEDNDETDPSTLGFEVTEVKVDKAEGYAEAVIRRVGGTQSPVSIQYATADGTAVAGTDYVQAEGTLMFYTGVDSIPLQIELIDDGIASDEELTFTLELSELLGDDNCTFTEATTVEITLWNSGTGTGDNLASVLYDAETVDVSSQVAESDTAANSEPEAVVGEQQALEEEEELVCQVTLGESGGELSTQSYYPNRGAITFARATTWSVSEDISRYASYWTTGRIRDSRDGTPGIYLAGGTEAGTGTTTISDVGQNYSDITINNTSVALYSKGAAYAEFNDTGYAALGTTAETLGQMFDAYIFRVKTWYGHDTSYLDGVTYRYSWTRAQFAMTQGSTTLLKPQYIDRHGSGPLNKKWEIKGGDSTSKQYNPYVGSAYGNFSMSGKVTFRLQMDYNGTHKREKDVQNGHSVVNLLYGDLTRRTFDANAFSIELSTPNDANTAPENCAVLDAATYNQMLPTISVTKGGTNNSGKLYVGSQIKVTAGQAPAGYKVDEVVIYRSTNGGSTWSKFDKFQISQSGDTFYIDMVGTGSNPLNESDLTADYKIRVCYARETTVTIDVAPSVPRQSDGQTVDTGKISYVTSYSSAYNGKSDHNFIYGTTSSFITYGCNYFDETDFSTSLSTESANKNGNWNGTKLSFSATNIQWVCFNLSEKDLLIINGVAYKGNETIYLTAADMAGGLNVLYYHEDYQASISSMDIAFRWAALYFDANGNGKIDGKYNENTGNFELDANADQFVGYVNPDDTINENEVRPVNGCQYFLKVCYNMTPRSLLVPEGASIDDKAQVLPAFITSVNADTPAYSEQTAEQKAYRYIVSGKTCQSLTAKESRSSDNHQMYEAGASAPSTVDIPLGGDTSPAYIPEVNGEYADYYVWDPTYMGSMLFPFSNPDPVTITNSLAGPTAVAEYTTDTDGKPVYTEGELDKINGYLASFTGNTTFALVSLEQKYTTEEIVSNVTGVSLGGGSTGASHEDDKYYVQSVEEDSSAYTVEPDSSTIHGFATVPDSEYLKVISSGSENPTGGADMADANTGMDEFNVDFGVDLGSNNIGITDYLTILMDGNRVGFSISVPLGGYEKVVGKTGEWTNPLDANKDAWTQFYDFFKKDYTGDDGYKKASEAHAERQKQKAQNNNNNNGNPTPSASPKPSASPSPSNSPTPSGNPGQNNAQAGKGSKFSSSKSFSVEFSVSLAMLFEYDPLSNDYYFCMMSISASVGLSFRAEARLTVFPLVYVYVQVSFSVDISVGLGMVRDCQEATPILDATGGGSTHAEYLYYHNSGEYESTQPRTYEFETAYKSFNLRFSGKVGIQVYEKDGSGWKLTDDEDIRTGHLSSDGQQDVEVILKQTDSMYIKDENTEYKIVLTAMEHDEQTAEDITIISRVAEITGTRDEVYFDGIRITPGVAIEFGAGIGVELLKFEAYIVGSLDATLLLCQFNEEWLDDSSAEKYLGGGIDSFNFNASIGLRVVLLIFTFELNAASFWGGYQSGTGWDYQISFFNDLIQLDAEEDEYSGMTINLPGSLGEETKLHTLSDNEEGELSTQAYDADADVPFQLSGFGESAGASTLGENMLLGGDYKAVSVGGRDFVVYTLKRNAAAAEDQSYLVMSEIVTSATTDKTYGLANPVDNSSATPYIVLDTETDATGDLDFDVWTEEKDGTGIVHAAWVSYAEPNVNQSEPAKPGDTPYQAAGQDPMSADNYTTYPVPAENSKEYADYTNWKNYFESLYSYEAYTQNRLANASKNTVVKTAQWSFTSVAAAEGEAAVQHTGETGFSAPEVVGGDNLEGNTNYVFAPASAGSGDVVFYGSTYSLDDGTFAAQYESYVESAYAAYADQGYQNYLIQTKQSINDVYGTASSLNLAYKDSAGAWQTSSVALTTLTGNGAQQTLSNVEFTKLDDGNYYVAYTTSQEEFVTYEAKDSNGAVVNSNATDLLTVERLYLRKVTVSDSGVTWGDPYLLRMTRNYENQTDLNGVYNTSGTRTAEYESPCFSNLSFLTANLDKEMLKGTEEEFEVQAVQEHTFLLFEMNGSTYIILDDSLKSITGTGKGTVYPFFTPPAVVDADGNVVTENTTGKQEVTIGVDGSGNVFAVYASAVANTSNNALYLSAYDAATGTWGSGTMLAMNNMNTYEASIRNDWGQRTTNAAYLGLNGVDNGLLTNADITNLYGSEYASDILATLGEAPESELGDSSNLVFSNIQAIKGLNNELLVLTEGTLTTMEVKSFETPNGDSYVLGPTYNGNNVDSSIGFYAIGYGKGDQELGEGSISFGNADFSAESALYVQIDVKNVGDAAFRGSADEPITATLYVAGQKIAEWTVSENIISGQDLQLDGYALPLAKDLKTGDKFTLTLSEYSDGANYNGVSRTIDLLTVELLPDLGVEEMDVSLTDISDDGTTSTLYVEFMAANRGSGDATAAYAQFSYVSGTDENGDPVYTALDIQENTLEVGNEEKLSTQAVTADEPTNGIKYLGNIQAGYGRRVKGTITVPSDVFAAGESEHLELKVELFDQNNSVITTYNAGVQEARHMEYNTDNNVKTAVVEASTEFLAAKQIVIALGSTTKIPLTAVSSRGTEPIITVEELDDTTDGLNIGILTYKASNTENGQTQGVVSFSPSKTGTGIVHVTDTDTNTTVAITFLVVDASEGIDIYNDNSAFAFRNADGTDYDKDAVEQDWTFDALNSWGSGDNADVPMRQNVSVGKPGASFTFDTVAESFDLYFQGEIEVTSDMPGFTTKTYTNNQGGKTATRVTLGSNTSNDSYSVTVTVKGKNNAKFDRLVEYYASGIVPLPTYDGENPVLIWNRSFPGTATIETGGKVDDLAFYAIDNAGIQSIKINGTSYTENSAGVATLEAGEDLGVSWMYTFPEITANGTYEITVTDSSGNKVSETLKVDWFLDNAKEDDTVNAPDNTAEFKVDGEAWDGTSVIKKGQNVTVEFTEPAAEEGVSYSYAVKLYEGATERNLEAAPDADNKFPVSSNGMYLAIITRTGTEDGRTIQTESRKLLIMDKFDASVPQVALTYNETDRVLEWTAYKESKLAVIETVTVNGVKVNDTSGRSLSGTLPIVASGTYTIIATDTAGNSNEAVTQDVTMVPNATEGGVSVVAAKHYERNNGSITVDPTKLTGGHYAGEATGDILKYQTSYQIALVEKPAEDATTDDLKLLSGQVWKTVTSTDAETITYSGLSDGTYYLAIKDANCTDTTHFGIVELVVEDQSIQLTAAYNEETGDIEWTATKGGTSGYVIDNVTVNGYKVNDGNGTDLSGALPINHSGKYTVVASDDEGNESRTIEIDTKLDVNMDACAVTVVAAKNWQRNNGSITADLTNVIGGHYTTASVPSENNYTGSYQVALVKSETDLTPIAGHDWQSVNVNDGWSVSFTDLSDGTYYLAVKDANCTDDTHYALRMPVVEDQSVQVTAKQEDDNIAWTATKGGTSDYYIDEVTVNDYKVHYVPPVESDDGENDSSSDSVEGTEYSNDLSGKFAITHSGLYTVKANDNDAETGGNGNESNTVTVDAAIPVSIADCTFTVVAAKNWQRNNGSIAADLSNTVGGYYTADSRTAENYYTGSYQACLVKSETDLTPIAGHDWQSVNVNDGWSVSFTDLSDGTYYLAVKDVNTDEVRYDCVTLVVEDQSIHLDAYQRGDSIKWTATKGGTSSYVIDKVTINGYKVNTENGTDLAGKLPITHSGKYTVVAYDNDTESGGNVSKVITVDAEVAINTYGCIFSVDAVKNADRDNGEIYLDLSKITGGYYTEQSRPEENFYTGSYEVALYKTDTELTPVEEQVWRPINSVDGWTTTYSGLEPGYYYLVIRDANSEEPRAYTRTIHVCDQSIHLGYTQEGNVLSWIATKYPGIYDLTEVTINGVKVGGTGDGDTLTGSMIITANGKYVIAAADAGGFTNQLIAEFTELPLSADNCRFTVKPAWNRAKNNGSVELDLSNMTGGYYSEEDSDVGEQDYWCRYEVALVEEGYRADQVKWTEVNRDDGWTVSYTGLEPGEYLVLIRDAVYEGETRQIEVPLTVEDQLLELELTAEGASSEKSKNGKIHVTTNGGRTGYVEYTVLRVDSENKTPTRFAISYLRTQNPDSLQWQMLTDGTEPDISGVIEGLEPGTYVVGVRSLLGITALHEAELEELKNDPAALKAYCKELGRISDLCYANYAPNWDGIDAEWIYVPVGEESGQDPDSAILREYTDENGSAVIELVGSDAVPGEDDRRRMAEALEAGAVVITADGVSAYIPFGTLPADYELEQLLIDPAAAENGMVIEYTDLQGSKRIVPWCLVEEGRVSYIVIGPGSYKLVEAESYFSDIEGLWGEDSIYFSTHRELFNGMGDGLFMPQYSMTRAMFVTVLWRMAGSQEAEKEAGFTDLTADWYAEAVNWAVENNIATGYSVTEFGPNDNVTREQMCAFLVRFLDYMDMELPEGNSVSFRDEAEISAWAKAYVKACSAAGLVNGMGEGNFAPKRNATRMEVATLLTRFITQMVEKYCAE